MMNKFEKIYEDTIPSNYILDKDSVLECMKKSYELGVNEERKRLNDIKSSYESIIDDIIDDPRCDTVKSISIENKKRNYGLI
jgi:hypothetical protein